jgi:hypothetical protein
MVAMEKSHLEYLCGYPLVSREGGMEIAHIADDISYCTQPSDFYQPMNKNRSETLLSFPSHGNAGPKVAYCCGSAGIAAEHDRIQPRAILTLFRLSLAKPALPGTIITSAYQILRGDKNNAKPNAHEIHSLPWIASSGKYRFGVGSFRLNLWSRIGWTDSYVACRPNIRRALDPGKIH